MSGRAMSRDAYSAALDIVCLAVPDFAERKNVPLADSERDAVATTALEGFHPRELHGLVQAHPGAVALAATAISRTLDILITVRVILLMAHLENQVPPAGGALLAQATDIVDRLVANDQDGVFHRWDDPFEIVRQHYAKRSQGPRPVVSMTLAQGRAHASFAFGDRTNEIAPAMLEAPHDCA
jgi:hypothetical protein